MRLSRNALIVAVLAAGCGHEPGNGPDAGIALPDGTTCSTAYMTYDNFGAPFMANWCQGCHSATLPDDMRQGSPTDVNFDTQAEVKQWAVQIGVCANSDGSQGSAMGCPPANPPTGQPPMPPSGGPPEDDRETLTEWLACGVN
jgi:hypothetical protein